MKLSEEQVKEQVIFYLIHGQQRLKNLCLDILTQKESLLKKEPIEFHDEIIKQSDELCLSVIIIEMSKDMALDCESIEIALDGFNLRDYFN